MSLPAPTTTSDLEVTDKLEAAVSASMPSTSEADDPAALEDTVSIELNFKAFADHVPPTEHAKRVTSHLDPSIQDFADQALELAALRAELRRLTRDYDALLRTLQRRDQHFQALQEELSNTRARLREATRQSSESVATTCASASHPTLATPQAVTTMKLAAITESGPNESTGKLSEEMHSVTIPDLLPVVAQNVSASLPATRQLQPVDHDGKPIVLDRDIITIGRTKRSDVCIASPAISRDHARLLITRNSVTIIDMGSGNGCFVNAERVNKCRLREGDVLTIGDRSYRLILRAS